MGSGKGTVANILKEKDFEFAVFSDVIIKEAIKQGIEINRKNLQDLGDQVRKDEFGGAWVKRILQEIDISKDYIFDGVRNPGEIQELGKTGKFILIYVDSRQDLRWERLQKTNNEKNPKTWDEFIISEKRDSGENQPDYGQQVDLCIMSADYVIVNNSNLESLKSQVLDILGEIKEKC